MAGALGGKAAIVAQLLTHLNLAPSPDNPVAVAVRCDCLQVLITWSRLPLGLSPPGLPAVSPWRPRSGGARKSDGMVCCSGLHSVI